MNCTGRLESESVFISLHSTQSMSSQWTIVLVAIWECVGQIPGYSNIILEIYRSDDYNELHSLVTVVVINQEVSNVVQAVVSNNRRSVGLYGCSRPRIYLIKDMGSRLIFFQWKRVSQFQKLYIFKDFVKGSIARNGIGQYSSKEQTKDFDFLLNWAWPKCYSTMLGPNNEPLHFWDFRHK